MQSSQKSVTLPDFDVLKNLHAQDPEAYEHFRRHLLREAIANSPAEHRKMLDGLLCKMDVVRETAATPLDAALGATRLMSDSVGALQSAWADARSSAVDMQVSVVLGRMTRGNGKQFEHRT